MYFSRTIYKNEIVYTVERSNIDDELVNSILNSKNTGKKIGINMENVKSINSEVFIKNLLNNRFRLFNIQSEVLAYLAIILKDGFLKSHMTFEDLCLNKRELVKRHFLVA